MKKNTTFKCCYVFLFETVPMPNSVVLYTLKHFNMRNKYFNCHINGRLQMEFGYFRF